MHQLPVTSRLLLLGLLAGACAGPSATGPADEQSSQTMPELAVEPGTAGTDRYVPILHRVFGQAVHRVARAQGEEQAKRLTAEARRRQQEVREALDAGDRELAQTRAAELDRFLASVSIRLFGPRVAGHVLAHARRAFHGFATRLEEAKLAGRDVTRLEQGFRAAGRHLEAARAAAGNENPIGALLHAARGADLLAHLHAAL